MPTMPAAGLTASQPPHMPTLRNLSCLLVLPQASYGLYVRYFVAKNPVLHSRTKHIDVRFHFPRDHYEKGNIDLVHVASKTKLADIFTKPLEFGAFVRLR
ncbi:hypothetical protein U9M48_031444, partial [Paspalum notatum var. saurae]